MTHLLELMRSIDAFLHEGELKIIEYKGPYIEGACCIPYSQGIDPHWKDFLQEAAHVGVSERQFSLPALRRLFEYYKTCVKDNKPFVFIPRVDVEDKNRSVFEFPSIRYH